MPDDKLHCRDCQYYRPQWHECCFGGGWGHYPDPDDVCVRMFYDEETTPQPQPHTPTGSRPSDKSHKSDPSD